jgi:hypothetical protein
VETVIWVVVAEKEMYVLLKIKVLTKYAFALQNLHTESLQYTVKIATSDTSGTKGLPDIVTLRILERYA